jgi:hypothetical protein
MSGIVHMIVRERQILSQLGFRQCETAPVVANVGEQQPATTVIEKNEGRTKYQAEEGSG